jgi:hypothetical protein
VFEATLDDPREYCESLDTGDGGASELQDAKRDASFAFMVRDRGSFFDSRGHGG